MSSNGMDQPIYTLESYNHSALLQLENNNTFAATGNTWTDLHNPNVYFYVETTNDSGLQYQFKPYSQHEKYIAVINGEILLKAENECTKSERSFYIHAENEDYMSFYVDIAGTVFYLYCENNKTLHATTTKPDEGASWFHMQPKDNDTNLAKSEELLFSSSSITVDIITELAEIVLAEE